MTSSDPLRQYWQQMKADHPDQFEERWISKIEPEVATFIERLKKQKAKTVLDIGCGLGRHTIALIRSDFSVTAFDGSQEAVDTTMKALSDKKLHAEVSFGDFRKFDYGLNQFDGALSINVIHHGYEAEVKLTIQKIHDSLQPHRIFLATVPIFGRKDGDGLHAEQYTYIPRSGPEIGVPHFHFTEEKVFELFDGFEIETVNGSVPENTYDHFVIFARKR